jgi:hypothetical protein
VRLLSLILLSAVVASGARADAIEKKDQIQVAALALPGGPQADWQQWDSFLTNVVKKLGADFQPALRDQLGETFLDSRYQLVQLLRAGSADPVPQLFTDAWNRLAPILKTSDSRRHAVDCQSIYELYSRDGCGKLFSGIGQRLGIFRITPDALRSAAGLIGDVFSLQRGSRRACALSWRASNAGMEKSRRCVLDQIPGVSSGQELNVKSCYAS